MRFAWISNDAYAACARKFTFVCQPLDVSIVLPPHGSLWCKCVSIVIAAPFAQHLRLPTRSAVSLFSQNRITEIRTNNWVTLKCSRMRIPNSSELAEWVVCRTVSRQLVRHSINQGTTDTSSIGRWRESGKGVGRY